jgi:hypothetical protein
MKRPRGQRDVQRTGLRLALGFGALFVAIVGGYIAWGSRGTKTLGGERVAAPKSRPDSLTGGSSTDGPQLGSASTVDIDLMDKKTPGRQAGELIFASMEPLEGGRYDVVKPQAWLFLKDGRTMHIRAAAGKLYMPVYGKEPESGTISGGVVIDFYAPKAEGARVDPSIDKAIGTLTTDSITFDATLGQLTTPDAFTLTSAQADLYGTGLQALFNEPKQRLEYFKIERGDRLVLRQAPSKSRKEPTKAAAPGKTASSTPTAVPVPPAATPTPRVETMYRMDLKEGIKATQATRMLTADALQVWARLVDGELAPDAIAEIKFANAETEAKAPEAKPNAGTQTEAKPVTTAGGAAPGDTAKQVATDSKPTDSPLTLYWSGPCEIIPLDTAPPELAKDSVTARFTAESAGLVKLSDTERSATGEAVAIEYGATTGRLSLIGSKEHHTFLDVPSAGRIESARLNADLVHGIVHVPGAGLLARGTDTFRLSWGDQADFMFLKKDGTLVNAISQAILSGAINASDQTGSIKGGFARADFVATPLNPNSLSRLILEESVVAESKKSGSLAADKIDVSFVPGTKDSDPVPRQLTGDGPCRG